jgi:hypothetical protein
MSRIFLSHSHADKPFALQLAADLQRHHHVPWLHEVEIHVGESLLDKIAGAIDAVDYVMAVISDASLASEWVRRELIPEASSEDSGMSGLMSFVQENEDAFVRDLEESRHISATLKAEWRSGGRSTTKPGAYVNQLLIDLRAGYDFCGEFAADHFTVEVVESS